MIAPLNLSIIYLLRVLLIRSTKTMIKIKRLQNIRRPKIFVGPKYSSAQNIRRPKIFVGPNFRRPKMFIGPNFRHLLKISSIRADKVWTDKVCKNVCMWVYARALLCVRVCVCTRARVRSDWVRNVYPSWFGIFELSMPYLKFYSVANSNFVGVIFKRHF